MFPQKKDRKAGDQQSSEGRNGETGGSSAFGKITSISDCLIQNRDEPTES